MKLYKILSVPQELPRQVNSIKKSPLISSMARLSPRVALSFVVGNNEILENSKGENPKRENIWESDNTSRWFWSAFWFTANSFYPICVREDNKKCDGMLCCWKPAVNRPSAAFRTHWFCLHCCKLLDQFYQLLGPDFLMGERRGLS